MNRLILFTITLLFHGLLFAQKINIGVSCNYMYDRDWGKSLDKIAPTFYNVDVISRTPINIGLVMEKRCAKVSPSVGINFIQRNLQYCENYLIHIPTSYHTLELPLNLTTRKNIGNVSALTLNVGGGANYALTQTLLLSPKFYDTVLYSFKVINHAKITGFIHAGIGIESKLKNSGTLQVKFQYVCPLTPVIQYIVYNSENGGVTTITKPFRTNYAMVGLTYYVSFSKKERFTYPKQ